MFTDGALARRAITGVFIEFAGATVDCCMQRQHLTAPDVHTVELVAATTRAGCIALLYFVAHYRNYTFLKSLRRRIGWIRYRRLQSLTTNMDRSVRCGTRAGIKHSWKEWNLRKWRCATSKAALMWRIILRSMKCSMTKALPDALALFFEP